MPKSKLRLLLNAEPFGFGPTASLASIFPHLRTRFEHIGYVGKNHTLDLQKPLPYEEIIDTSGLDDIAEEAKLKDAAGRYDMLLSALDFATAEKCRRAGLRVCIYDPLTWYWPAIPPIIRQSDIYFAQDFFGVRERIAKHPDLFPRVEVVPPTVSRSVFRSGGDHVLLNLGGLQNPFWAFEDTLAYADIIISSVKRIVPASIPLIITTSSAVAGSLKKYDVLHEHDIRTCTRADMHDVFARSLCAFMTPGLGNIYDAAKFSLPTAWLPPANDSQGQQLKIIEQHALSDAAVDWPGITGKAIDYRGEQTSVLKEITEGTRRLLANRSAQAAFEAALGTAYELIGRKKQSAAAGLLAQFGSGGAEKIAEILGAYAAELENNQA